MRRRGFTILELLLALSLASLAVGIIAGLYGVLGVANRNAGERFGSAARNTLSYEIMQRTFTDLVAATPLLPGESPESDELPSVDQLAAMLTGSGEESAEPEASDEPIRARVAENTPVMFNLEWVEAARDVVVQRLELVTLDAPAAVVPLADEEFVRTPTDEQRERWASPDRVRSVFEFVYVDDEERWDLQWRAVDPPGEPVQIIEGVVSAQWTVLNRTKVGTVQEARREETWTDVSAAFLGEDFPIAVRLDFETLTGERGDWLFETVVITRAY